MIQRPQFELLPVWKYKSYNVAQTKFLNPQLFYGKTELWCLL
jgi:hypothetical protein